MISTASTLSFQPSLQSLPISAFLAARGPVIDVRSPSEWSHGRIPGALNLPLFDDRERALVGTTFKDKGRQAAVQLGLEMVGPKLAAFSTALNQLGRVLEPGEAIRLHCARGGMRSKSLAFLASLSLPVIVLEGGYKSFRTSVLDRVARPIPKLVVLTGPTGSGKSEILRTLRTRRRKVLDLEGLAGHRGSAFGGLLPVETPFPARLPRKFPDSVENAFRAVSGSLEPTSKRQEGTEQFENAIAEALWDLTDSEDPVFTEHENRNLGIATVPLALHGQLCSGPRIQLSVPRSERLARIVREYGSADVAGLSDATLRISKKLGGERTKTVLGLIESERIEEAAGLLLDHYDVLYARAAVKRGDVAVATIKGVGWDSERWADEVEGAAEGVLGGMEVGKMVSAAIGG